LPCHKTAAPFPRFSAGGIVEIMMRQYAAEVIGTFALVLAGTGAITINDVSGAHLNPAVTFGFWITRRFEGRRGVPYVGSQLIGGLAASLILRLLFPDHATLGTTLPAGAWWQSFVLEVLLTALLMFVILCVSTGEKEKGIMAGAAVGAVIALEALFAGPICGASMNPVRSVAPAVVSGHLEHLWIYIAAPVLGAAAGVGGWLCVRPDNPSNGGAAPENNPPKVD
jgi:aquaporin Z